LFEPAFGAHLDHVAETCRGDQRRARAAPFDQRIGGQRRAVDDLADLRRADPRLGADLMHPVDNRILGGGIGGQHLGRMAGPRQFQHHIGESAADIDAEPDCVLHDLPLCCHWQGKRAIASHPIILCD
jgi:hypothetical protein